MKVQIYAQKGTNKKFCTQIPEVEKIIKKLNTLFGGEWLLVDTLAWYEGIAFEDDLVYHGFAGSQVRYSDQIHNMISL